MALTIVTRPPKHRKFLVYDLEWRPSNYQVRIVGVYDGNSYRCYTTVAKFLENELTHKNRGKWFYAHFGGGADAQFIQDEIIKQGCKSGWEVTGSFSGSSAIIINIRKGKNSFHLVDSYWLLRDSLANIAKWFGLEKGRNVENFDNETALKRFYEDGPLTQLIDYNTDDCTILWNAIDHFEQRILSMGGQLQMTLASTAMQLFRRQFLKNEIDTNESVNIRAKDAYTASRVEVFEAEAFDANYYDINSSFPFAMTQPCPGNIIGTTTKLPSKCKIYLADVEVEIKDCYLPPIPYRFKDRIFFPTGRWRSWMTSVDIELLLENGGTIHKTHECILFDEFYDLKDYAINLYETRKRSKDEAEKQIYKLLLNALYGKFAEESTKQQLHIYPNLNTLNRIDAAYHKPGCECKHCFQFRKVGRPTRKPQMLTSGVWLEPKVIAIPHRHVPIAAHITALARRNIFNWMAMCRNFHYCDTDGFSTNEELDNSTDLGRLKHEDTLEYANFISPKVYLKKLAEGTYKTEDLPEGIKVKAKGFSLGKDKWKAVQKWRELAEGNAITVERMVRILENYRTGVTAPREASIKKRFQRDAVVTKRMMYPDGKTRPWTIKELEDNL